MCVVHDGPSAVEAARLVRAEEGLEHVVLVALTGYGREEDRRQAVAAGFDHHLVKPVNPDALLGLVSELPPTSKGPTLQ